MEERRYRAEDEVDLRELVLRLWERRWVVVGATVAAAVVTAALSLYVLPPVYESRTYIQLSKHSSPAYATPQAAARVLTSMSFLRPIAARHGIPEGRRLERMVRAEPVRDTRIVYVRVRDRDPERLRAFTQELVQAFLTVASERVRERRRLAQEHYRTVTEQVHRLAQLTQGLATDLAGRAGRTSTDVSAAWLRQAWRELVKAHWEAAEELAEIELPYLVQEPYVPREPVSPRPALNSAVAGVLGFLVSVFGVLVRDAWARMPQGSGAARTSTFEAG